MDQLDVAVSAERLAGGVVMRLGTAVDEYLRLRRTMVAKATVKNDTTTLYRFARSLPPDLEVDRLRRHQVEAWLETNSGLSPASLRHGLSTVRTFTAWLADHGRLRHDPCAGIQPPRQPQGLPRELEGETVERLLLAAPDTRAALVISLMVQEGLRRAEVARIELGDVDFAAGMILVHGKGRSERWLPVTAQTARHLGAYLAEHPATSGPLIRSYVHPSRGVTAGYVGRLVTDWMREAGVKAGPRDGRSAHSLRHTMAGAMLDDGADVREVQAALGHSNLGATYGYLRRRQASTKLRGVMGTRSYGSLVPAEGDA